MSQTVPQTGRFYADHIAPLITLAWPLILSQASWTVLMTIDSIMVGQYSAEELSYLSLGRSFVYFCWGTGFGFLAGVLVFIAQAYGAERMLRAGLIFRVGLSMAIVFGAILAVALTQVGWIFRAAGIEPDLAHKATQFAMISAPGLLGGLVFLVGSQFLEALARPKPVMVMNLWSAAINAVLNFFLIYGIGPIPAMGANGAALGTTITIFIITAWILSYILRLPDRARFGLTKKIFPIWRAGRTVWRFGVPVGFAISLEMLALSALTVMAGTLGKIPLAAYEIFIAMFYLPFAIIEGLAQASAIRVGHAVGARQFAAIPGRVGVGLALNMVFLLPFSLACLIIPDLLATAFTTEAAVVEKATPLLRVLGIILLVSGVFDGIGYPVRTMGDSIGVSAIQIGINWLILVPLAAVGVFVWQGGIISLAPALLLTPIVGSLLLIPRGIQIWRRLSTT